MTRIASVHGTCIQRRLYEAARIWRLRVPLGIWRNLFRLTFPLGASCAVNFPKFRPLYKAPWEVYLPHLWFLESCRSYKFFHFLEQQMPPESWALRLRQRMRRLKILLLFNRTRKSSLLLRPGTIVSADHARFLIILQTPIKNVQELAKEEGKKSEAKLRGAIEISEGAFSAIAGSWRDPWRAILYYGKSTDIILWIRVCFKAASAGGNQFRHSRLFFLLTTCAKHTGLEAA